MTISGHEHKLLIYKNEPLIYLITRSPYANPISLGALFFFLVSLPLTLWAILSQPSPENNKDFVTFLENISWSVSIIYLFPFVVALTLKYYESIPELFYYLFSRLNGEDKEGLEDFEKQLDKSFNAISTPIFIFVITVALNIIYFQQTLNDEDIRWLSSGSLLQSLLDTKHGFSPVGLYAQFIQILLIYWILMAIWKGFVFAWALHRFFKIKHDAIAIDPLHPDGSCGLKRIGNVASILNLILFLIGVYLSLRIIDKAMIQNSSVFEDIGNPMMLGGYAIVAPLLFFLPLSAAHNKMLEAKQKFILPVSRKCEQLFKELEGIEMDEKGHEAIASLEEMERLRHEVEQEIPVWPFDFRSVQAFFGTIVVPLLPVIIPLVFQLLVGKTE
jgi:hypothetical protein